MTELPPPRTVFELLEWQASTAPDHEGLVAGSDRLSHANWHERARRVGNALRAGGVARDDGVALLCDNRAAWLEVYLGACHAGARLIALNTWAKTWDLEYMLGHARPRVLFTVDRLGKQDFLAHLRDMLPELWQDEPGAWRSARFPELEAVVVLGEDVPPGAHAFDAWCASGVGPDAGTVARPDDIAVVMFTSGSTARPKAVPLVHRHLVENGFEIGERQRLTTQDRVFLASPLFWSYGGANALMATLTHGATLVLQSQFRAAEALQILEAERCTSLYTLPAMTHALLDDPSFSQRRLATLRTGMTIGAPAELRLVAEGLGATEVCNVYGSTEVYGNCCVTPADAPFERRLHSQGPPLGGVELKVVDLDTREELPPGEAGEILVRGRVTPGYLDEAGTAVPVVDAAGFYRTGDLGRVDADGWVSYEGRATEMIKTAGINVSPSEVEDFLVTHPDVLEAAVAGANHPVRGEEVIAFVRLAPGATSTPEVLRSYCRERIAGFKVPAVVRVVDGFPLTDTGKLARRELKAWADEAAQGTR